MRGIHVREGNLGTTTKETRSVEINFAPSYVVAKTSLSRLVSRGGGESCVIRSARRRDGSSGAETWVDAGHASIFSGDSIFQRYVFQRLMGR